MEFSDETLHEMQRLISEVDMSGIKPPTPGLEQAYIDRLQEIEAQLREELDDDVRFFDERPYRQHRMRRSFPAEKHHICLLGVMSGNIVTEQVEFAILVKRTTDSEYIRLPLLYSADTLPTTEYLQSLTEEDVKMIWESIASGQIGI